MVFAFAETVTGCPMMDILVGCKRMQAVNVCEHVSDLCPIKCVPSSINVANKIKGIYETNRYWCDSS